MNCHYCNGNDTYKEIQTCYLSSSQDNPIFIENLPVLECIQCGEQIISGKSMNILDNIHNNKPSTNLFKTIPVYDYNNFQQEYINGA